ncbi:alkaline phosphatase D family protein [Candidatus Uabimicrobium amorphum]|uniref:Alkaline phosphatase n=1 Tax=Uabimicrobium amorphum TaxID=2596890 RepID=A0A5S9IQ47_UABAM|nr:alkaline phosphatase D family protein [Candidatus Uabimicrobium amorphum]BBM84625.1 alkaline phosphatase [Candidatus Uabimicrobium amorphum]
MRYLIFVLILLVSCHADQRKQDSFVIAFGSCNKQYKKQPLWDVILQNSPNLWVWLGDVIYADTEDMSIMQQKYQQQRDKKKYQKFRSKVPIIGTWDDHDYGVNNGGKEYPAKVGSQKLFLDFLDEPQSSKRRTQQGIYWAYTYDVSPKLKVKVLVLDTRYHREMPGRNTDILGESQWQWLQDELQNSKAHIHIICSSIQVLSRKHRYEKWANFPQARKRLLDLLQTCNSVLLLSGDRHFSEISCLKRQDLPPIFEVTSSGMTHNASIPLTVLRKENSEYRVSDCFNKKNFGVITIDESNESLSLEIHDKNNRSVLQQNVSFSSLGVHYAK